MSHASTAALALAITQPPADALAASSASLSDSAAADLAGALPGLAAPLHILAIYSASPSGAIERAHAVIRAPAILSAGALGDVLLGESRRRQGAEGQGQNAD